MIRLKTLGPNCHEVSTDAVSVLFSYATPVAAHIAGEGYYSTAEKHSVTTSRHINAYIGHKGGTVVAQDWIDGFVLAQPFSILPAVSQ